MTPDNYKFSMKLNKFITHRLELNGEVREKIDYILSSTQLLEEKLGAIVILLSPSFKFNLESVSKFLSYFRSKVNIQKYEFYIAIEFRNKNWFNIEIFDLLKKYNVAIVVAQSSRYPGTKEITANFAYIRLHGPDKLFASSYSDEQLIQ